MDGDTEVFSNEVSMCCNGVVNDRPNGRKQYHKCCQTKAFNTRWRSCKNGVVVRNADLQTDGSDGDLVDAPIDEPVDE